MIIIHLFFFLFVRERGKTSCRASRALQYEREQEKKKKKKSEDPLFPLSGCKRYLALCKRRFRGSGWERCGAADPWKQ